MEMSRSTWIATMLAAMSLFVAACVPPGDGDPLVADTETETGDIGTETTRTDPGTTSGKDGDGTAAASAEPGQGPSSSDGVNNRACWTPATSGEETTDARIEFFALCIDDFRPVPVFRTFDPDRPSLNLSAQLEARIESLISGTTEAEQSAGLTVGFDSVDEVANIDVVAGIDGTGVATIEFFLNAAPWDPGARASAAAQLASFLDPLLATTFLDSQITGIDLSPLCWGPLGCDSGITTRASWETGLLVNHGIPSTFHCDPTSAWLDPNACTIDGLIEADSKTPATVVRVADDDTLNIRAGAGVDHTVLGEVPPDAEVVMLDAAANASDGGVWLLIVDPAAPGDGPSVVGWVNASFLRPHRSVDDAKFDALVAFAEDPGPAAFDRLELAPTVGLGLGPDLRASHPASSLASPENWRIDDDQFRGREGTFSVFTLLEAVGSDARFSRAVQGPHPHCASGPVEPPPGFSDDRRISIQPRSDLITSCLQWWTVDLFLDDDGRIEVIALDLWEP